MRYRVGAIGVHLHPAKGRASVPGRGALRSREGRLGEGDHRVPSIRHRRGARMIGLPGHREAVAAVRPDHGSDPDGGVHVNQCPSLLNVNLDVAVDGTQEGVVTPEALRVQARLEHRGTHRAPIAPDECAGPLWCQLSGEQPGPGAGDSEGCPLLIGEGHDGQGPVRRPSALPQGPHGRESGDHPEGPVEGAAIGNRVQVRPEDQGRCTVIHSGGHQARPHVSIPVRA